MDIFEGLAAPTEYACRVECCIGNTRAVVRSNDPLAIETFNDYMPSMPCDMFDVTATCDIAYVCDPALESRIRASVETHDAEAFWIKVDVCFLRMRVGGYTVYLSHIDEITSEDYAIVGSGSRYWVICRNVTEKVSRVSVRLFREILLRHLENIGGCFAHAAAIAKSGSVNGLLVIGDSGAGKSTTVWQLCQTDRFDYVSNDKSIIVDDSGLIKIVCWPLAARLGIGALTASGKLDRYREKGQIREQDASLWAQSAEDEHQKRANWGNKVKLSLTPRELQSYEGIESRASCVLSGLLVPRLRLGDGALQIAETSFESHRAMIERNLLEPYDEDIGRGWLGIRTVADDFLEAKKAALMRTLSNMPLFELHGDPGMFASTVDSIADAIEARC